MNLLLNPKVFFITSFAGYLHIKAVGVGKVPGFIEEADIYAKKYRIDWDRELLKETNRQNTSIIEENVERLVLEYPEKAVIFKEYLRNQLDECEELENDYICTTVLLGH